MATRDGYKIGRVLVDSHGWSFDFKDDCERYGDIPLVDPENGETVSPHEAIRRQTERCGGESATDSPLRELDPLKWSALRAIEFSETVPYCMFNGEPVDQATAAQVFIHLNLLAKFCRDRGVL